MLFEGHFWTKTGEPVGSEPAWNRCYWWKGGCGIGQSLSSLQWKWDSEREREWISCVPRELKRQSVWKSQTLQYRQPVRVREASARPHTYTDTHTHTHILGHSLSTSLCLPHAFPIKRTEFMQTCTLQQLKKMHLFALFFVWILVPATLEYGIKYATKIK